MGHPSPLLSSFCFYSRTASTIILPATAQASGRQDLLIICERSAPLVGAALVYGLVAGRTFTPLGTGHLLPFSIRPPRLPNICRFCLIPPSRLWSSTNFLAPVAEGLGKQVFCSELLLVMLLIKTGNKKLRCRFLSRYHKFRLGTRCPPGVRLLSQRPIDCCLLLRRNHLFSKHLSRRNGLLFHPRYLTSSCVVTDQHSSMLR